ncbi:hypothetical protein FLO80_05700 [Aquicoccus porphyridii]|uniref:Secreted protein n=1 Tax=Aquicoccus porphyridii TaxID=1852029 RepID=A0A5A9ZKM4_9RHOB|nr:hypothetical protein [Aquicoccus porphyridii]KAA0917536.1 hypothetical protein FLO80_05700 [Aquicoccus porphyridii]RAI55616.1 hypothetical protein DOO74_04225 [Rhodobacteraceae bacterium AsT-22]
MKILKPLLASCAGFLMMTQVVSAQQVTATAVVSEGGTGDYPVTVQGSDGQLYNCQANVETMGGRQVRRCVSATSGGGGDFGAQAGPLAGAAVLLGVLAVASSDGT